MRLRSLQFLSMLLTSQPEQEHNLLKLLANKLGDSERSIASRASYHLLNILQAHPGMKGVLVREVADLILKPPSQYKAHSKVSHPSTKGASGSKSIANTTTANVNARYYGIVTFNQIVLSSKTPTDRGVANKLLEVYFEVFRTVLGEGNVGEGAGKNDEGDEAVNERDGKGREEKRKMREKDRLRKLRHSNVGTTQGGLVDGSNDSDSKLISALLTGVNRALVFSNLDDALLDKQMDTLFRLTHEGGGSFNVAVQALGLIGKVAERRPVSIYIKQASRIDPLTC
jgi:ribosome biogenesis protein MAK21